jgi:hypothetical protein
VLAESWNPLNPGSERIARLFLPDGAEPIKCLAKATSCKLVKNESEKRYHIGFEFVAMDATQAERLNVFVLMLSAI